MAKQPRHQTVISRQSDSDYSEDHWLREFESKLQKTSVQPRGESVYDQINSIMNTKSKYPSVQAAVDDMMHRSGLSTYLDNVKESHETPPARPKKVAQQIKIEKKPQVNEATPEQTDTIPQVIKEKPSIARTLDNIIKESKGNMPIPAIISRLHSLHARDISDEGAWDDERLLRLNSQLNLQAKKDNPSNFENFDHLGQGDRGTADSDIDKSNTDAFNALMPAKI
jgi:hypothetical protein